MAPQGGSKWVRVAQRGQRGRLDGQTGETIEQAIFGANSMGVSTRFLRWVWGSGGVLPKIDRQPFGRVVSG